MPQLAVLALELFETICCRDRNPSPLAALDFSLFDLIVQSLCRAADLCGNRHDRLPAGSVLGFIIQHEPDRPLPDFR